MYSRNNNKDSLVVKVSLTVFEQHFRTKVGTVAGVAGAAGAVGAVGAVMSKTTVGVIAKDNPVMVAPGLKVSLILVVVGGLVEEVDLTLQLVQLLDVLQVSNILLILST